MLLLTEFENFNIKTETYFPSQKKTLKVVLYRKPICQQSAILARIRHKTTNPNYCKRLTFDEEFIYIRKTKTKIPFPTTSTIRFVV